MDSNGKRNRENTLNAISQSNALSRLRAELTADFIVKTFITLLKLAIRT